MTPARFRALFGLAILLILTGVIGGALHLSSRQSPALPDHGRVPDFSFTERSGETVRRADLDGEIWIADFIFTRCRGICPIMTTRMMEIQSAVSDRESIRLVSITVDPEHDTPPVLAEFAGRYGADPERWLFLTGEEAAIYGWIRAGFHLPAEGAEDVPGAEASEPFVHSPHLVLIDTNGRIRGYYDATDREAVERLMVDLDTLARSIEIES